MNKKTIGIVAAGVVLTPLALLGIAATLNFSVTHFGVGPTFVACIILFGMILFGSMFYTDYEHNRRLEESRKRFDNIMAKRQTTVPSR